MKGFFYRLGDSIKDAGERAGHKRRWFAGGVIRIGYLIKGIAMKERAGGKLRKI